ncbi:MAG: RodZ domain-containing protein [Smithellaceae bacterium]
MTQEQTATKDFLGIRAKREASGMTLKDVYAVTRISVVNLEAIENGAFEDLPVPTYTKNFIKTYARALGMDSKPILDSYEAYLNSLQTTSLPVQQQAEKENVREEKNMPNQPERKSPVAGKGPARYKAYLGVAAVLGIAAVAGIFVYQQQQAPPLVTGMESSTDQPAGQVAVSTPVTEPATQAVAPATALPAPSVQTTPSGVVQPVVTEVNKQVPAQPGMPQQRDAAPMEKKQTIAAVEGDDVLVIRATEETWLRIKIDQNPPFQVLLKPGEVIQRKGSAVGMDIGNAGGIKVQFKGKVVENIGKSGEVVHLQLP